MQVGLHCEMRVIQTMEVKHGFLLSGSFPHKVFVSVTVIAFYPSVSVASLSLTMLTHTPLGNTNLRLKLIGFQVKWANLHANE